MNRLLVVSVDSMHHSDLDDARTLPAFARILEHASTSAVECVYPTLTYPNHVAQITGCPPGRSGIFNNLQCQPELGAGSEWFWGAHMLKVPTIFEAAHAAGLSTASVLWPVTAGDPHIDWLVPELVVGATFPYETLAEDYRQHSNPHTYDRYIAEHVGLIRAEGTNRYAAFGNRVAPLILEHERPQVMFMHFCEVDNARHAHGAHGPHVAEALGAVDRTLGDILEALERNGDLATTNIVLVSDHGQVDVAQQTSLNAVFVDRGFMRLGAGGALIDYDVFCLGAGFSAQVFLAPGISQDRRSEVEALLAELQRDPVYGINRIWTTAEASQAFGLDGPFDWVVETRTGVMVVTDWARRPVVRTGDPELPDQRGSHGHLPSEGEPAVLVASGPDIVAGRDLGRTSILDQAPTFARLLGLTLPDAEGSVLTDLVR